MQMPADMKTVEEQQEDVPRDMRCYQDADGHTKSAQMKNLPLDLSERFFLDSGL